MRHALLPCSFLALASLARADFNFANFTSTAGLSLTGAAAGAGAVLRLTPSSGNQSGAAWNLTKQSVANGFETTFQFQLESANGADGFAFVVQNTSATALGGAGCELGYHGLANSLAVEFDTYSNGSCSVANVNDPANLHISVHTLGIGANSVAESASIAATSAVPNFTDGAPHTARIRYAGGVLSVFVDNLAQPVLSAPLALASTLSLDQGRAWVGFTAATGGLAERHDVLDWDFDETVTSSGNVPPATPTITEPTQAGQVLNAADVHMECAPFSDANPGDQHLCTDWEIWTVAPSQRVWATLCIGGVERLHTHFGDGQFEGSHAGRTELFPSTNYVLRVRHSDDSGDALTSWSGWAQRNFTTGDAAQIFPLEIDDLAHSPLPVWRIANSQTPIYFSPAATPSRLFIEDAAGMPLIEVRGDNGFQNLVFDQPPLAMHDAVRVRFQAGSSALGLPASDFTVVDHDCETHTLYLPTIALAAGAQAVYWINSDGASFAGSPAQTTPVFTTLARAPSPAWRASQDGFKVELVATGFQLPVNLAFAPNPGTSPTSPFLYVSELYGSIKVIQRNRVVSTYASGLINFSPTGAFPGSGEQGLTGLAVDPATGDLFAAMLYAPLVNPANHFPKIVRFTSNDGGRTAATQTTILDMAGETQGQSHQISNLTLLPDGTLLCHMGDGFDSSTGQNLNSFRGKILRLNLNGTPVASNPFFNAADGITSRDYVYAYGLRNPFGGEYRAADGAQYFVENGPSVDRFAKLVSGRNYGWDGSDASMANFALYNWNPPTGPVNLAFVQPQSFGGSGFPASSQGHAFVTESGPTYASGQNSQGKRITEWVLNSSGALVAGPLPFLRYTGFLKATTCGLEAGPDGLYFSDLYREQGFNPTAAGANVLRVYYEAPRDCNGNGLDDVCDVVSGSSADSDLNGVPDECDCRGVNYCTAKVNSAGCTPQITSSGSATLGGADDFVLRANNVLNERPGMLIWSFAPAAIAFGGGTRCVAAPSVRTPLQDSGGSTSGVDCTGAYAFALSDAAMASAGFSAGSPVYFQYWSRDSGFNAPNNIGLTDALRVLVCP
jgi:glucose/arabinose dehydrogenase